GWSGRNCPLARLASPQRTAPRRRDLRRLARAAGRHALEERDGLRLPVNAQLELFGSQAVNELPLLIKNHQVRLHQFGLYPQDIFVLGGGFLLRSLLRLDNRRCRHKGEYRDEKKSRRGGAISEAHDFTLDQRIPGSQALPNLKSQESKCLPI